MPTLPQVLHDLRHRAHWRFLHGALLLIVAVAALMPGSAAPSLGASDKLDHLLAFAALAFTGHFAGPRAGWRQGLMAAGLLAYGGGIELAQTQVPGRYAEWADLVTDAVGVAGGLALAWAMRRGCPVPPR